MWKRRSPREESDHIPCHSRPHFQRQDFYLDSEGIEPRTKCSSVFRHSWGAFHILSREGDLLPRALGLRAKVILSTCTCEVHRLCIRRRGTYLRHNAGSRPISTCSVFCAACDAVVQSKAQGRQARFRKMAGLPSHLISDQSQCTASFSHFGACEQVRAFSFRP